MKEFTEVNSSGSMLELKLNEWVAEGWKIIPETYRVVLGSNNRFYSFIIIEREIPEPQPISEADQTPLVATDGYEPENDGYETRTAKP